jgi:hypothetical protein
MRKTIKNNFRKNRKNSRKSKHSRKYRNTRKYRGGSSGYGGGFRPKGYTQLEPPPVLFPPPVAPPLAPPVASPAYNPYAYSGGMVKPKQGAVQAALQAGAALATVSPAAGAALASAPPASHNPYGGGMAKPLAKFDHKGEGGGSYDLPPRPPQLGRQPTISAQLYNELLSPDNVVLFNKALFDNIRSFIIQDERGSPHRFLETTPTGHYATFDDKSYDVHKKTHLTIHTPSPEHAGKPIGALHVRFNFEPPGQEWPYRRILLYDTGREITVEIDRHNGYKGSKDNADIIERIANEVISSIMQYYRDSGRVIRKIDIT